jgi:hypothetical protein
MRADEGWGFAGKHGAERPDLIGVQGVVDQRDGRLRVAGLGGRITRVLLDCGFGCVEQNVRESVPRQSWRLRGHVCYTVAVSAANAAAW